MKSRSKLAALLLAALSGCSRPLDVGHFAGSAPSFDPIAFWTGHVRSWGVVETRGGAPTDTVETDCLGVKDGADGLRMQQTITEGDGTVTHRDWTLRRVAPGRFEASANDMAGPAEGEAAGRAFHWRWVWRRQPGNPLGDVAMSQWMYLYPDGTLLNRTVISKLGVTVAEVTERFEHSSPN